MNSARWRSRGARCLGSRAALRRYILCMCVMGGCATALPQVPEVPVQSASDWRVPTPEWDLLHRELLRCRENIQGVARRFRQQRTSYTTYNTIGSIVGVSGASASISGVLSAAGADNPDVNKALGIGGAVVAALGPMVFSLLSHQEKPGDLRTSYERMSAAYVSALRTRSAILYCESLLARTPEVAFSYPSDAPEVLADRARYQESCSAFYAVPPARGEPAPARASETASRQRLARQIIDPEYQLTQLTDQLRQRCVEALPEAEALQSFSAAQAPAAKDAPAATAVKEQQK